jgi:hypothetical protein
MNSSNVSSIRIVANKRTEDQNAHQGGSSGHANDARHGVRDRATAIRGAGGAIASERGGPLCQQVTIPQWRRLRQSW